MFESLLLLKSGRIIYQGSTSGALTFYEHAGYPCPPLTNPADHLLDVIQPALGVDDAVKQDVTEKLLGQYREPEVDLSYGSDMPLSMDRQYVDGGEWWHCLFCTVIPTAFLSHQACAVAVPTGSADKAQLA